MDITRKQFTNVERAGATNAPRNTFLNLPAYPPTNLKMVVRPNFDTLYSSALLVEQIDLNGPVRAIGAG
jgi:hypothetical protein